MTVDTETILIKLIEELRAEAKQTNQTLTSIKEKVADLEFRLEEKTIALFYAQKTIITKLNGLASGFPEF